jgi:hypothetical protein
MVIRKPRSVISIAVSFITLLVDGMVSPVDKKIVKGDAVKTQKNYHKGKYSGWQIFHKAITWLCGGVYTWLPDQQSGSKLIRLAEVAKQFVIKPGMINCANMSMVWVAQE